MCKSISSPSLSPPPSPSSPFPSPSLLFSLPLSRSGNSKSQVGLNEFLRWEIIPSTNPSLKQRNKNRVGHYMFLAYVLHCRILLQKIQDRRAFCDGNRSTLADADYFAWHSISLPQWMPASHLTLTFIIRHVPFPSCLTPKCHRTFT